MKNARVPSRERYARLDVYALRIANVMSR